VGIVAFVGLSLSLGGLTWWLVTQARSARSSPAAEMQEQVTADFSTRDGATIAGEKAVASVIELFNGHDLEGWDFDPDVWSVRNGVIYGHQKRGGYGSSLFWRDANLDDFELRFRFRLVRGNSGIYYRANRLANFDVGGYEFEVYTNRTGNLADNGTDRVKRRLHRAEAAESIDAEWHEGSSSLPVRAWFTCSMARFIATWRTPIRPRRARVRWRSPWGVRRSWSSKIFG
jgi:hypothetical protein